MAEIRRDRTTGLYNAFYWIGIAMTLACFAFVLAGNTELLYRFEHTRFPLAWAFGALAVVSFLATEALPLPESAQPDFEEQPALSTELETVGF